jgi:hypothetical protein
MFTLFVPDLKETMTEDKKERFYKNKNMGECTEGVSCIPGVMNGSKMEGGKALRLTVWSSEAPMHLLFLGRQVAKINRRKGKG